MFLLLTLFVIYLTGVCDGAACIPVVCEDNPVLACGKGQRLVHGPQAKIITCQSDDECLVSVNIDIIAGHFLHCLSSSLCIVDFDRIKRYIPKNITGIRMQGDALDDNTIGIGLRNLSCSLRHVNTLRLKLLNCSCLPDKGFSFFDIYNKPNIRNVNSDFLLGYKLQSKTTGTDDFRICSVTASTGIFSEVAVVQSFVGKEDVKIKSKEVGCVCLSHNTFYTYKKIGNSTTGTLTLEIPPRNVLQKNKAFQILLWIKVTKSTIVSMKCKGRKRERLKGSSCTPLIVKSLTLTTPIPETDPEDSFAGSPINPITQAVEISVVAGVVLIVVVTCSIASAVVYTRRYKRKLGEPQYDTLGSTVSSSHYTIPSLSGGGHETLPRHTQTTTYTNSAYGGNQIDELGRPPILTPILPSQIRKSPAIATLSDNSAGYSHAFDHLPGIQGHHQRPNLSDSGSSSKPNYVSFSNI
ncbi:uncharacterized protein LOC128156023 isoform X1 [Crassostrea angulata]|uniref:uncharacterized protein LOC128156023 isoform X1 n=1 Tax=Magallana angulata TaxID=2784310 RepID=UPI0022B21A0B|nr:uncharacterized protein LOC128156023 isoform X1 [Crassostrea angulata]